MKRIAGLLVLLGLPLAGACAGTKVLSSWTAPDFQPGSVKRVLVVGVARDPSVRRTYEDSFALELAKRDVAAVASWSWIPDPDPEHLDREALAKRMAEEGTTHVLVTRLIDRKIQETYHPPTTVGVGVGGYPGYYGGWYSFYSTAYVTPGYVSQQEILSLETNIYAVSPPDGKLIWSGVTETFVASSPVGEIKGFIAALVYELRAKKII